MLGALLITAGLAGTAFAFRRQILSKVFKKGTELPITPPSLPSDKFSPHAERKRGLEVVETKQTIRLLGEDLERQVLATVAFNEMTQVRKDSPWTKTGNVYRAVRLAGDIWIFKIPSQEGGEPMWVKAEKKASPGGLMDFYRGTDETPGPARKFKNNGQSEPVAFSFPARMKDATEYEIIDIGRFQVSVDGTAEGFISGDNYPFVTVREQGGKTFILDLEAKKDLAQGSGGFFKGEQFEPDIDIAELL